MPRAGIEPATRGFSVLCSTNWAIWALSSGDRIWTYDLRVMSPTSFQTAPPRVIKLYASLSINSTFWKKKWAEVDSNHRSNLQQIYSLSPLATRESAHKIFILEPMIGLEPITCWLQVSCSANWATSAYLLNGAYRARTCDPLLVRQMLSQLS